MKAFLKRSPSGLGFSLVEIMVSITVISLLMVVLASMIDSARRTWSYTNSKVEEFRSAREAFESITRRLSQATLNTYWDYSYPNGGSGQPDTTQTPTAYIRQSELRFISDNSTKLTGNAASPTHAVFFQAPTGSVGDLTNDGLNKLLNTCGYYIEFNDDSESRPDFIKSPLRYRFRLMEMVEPSESFSLYDYETKAGSAASYTGYEWFLDPIRKSYRRVLAENIIALVLLPKLTPQEDSTGILLSPNYSYDSTSIGQAAALNGTTAASVNSKNQLPPVVQVTLVAVDEPSFSRFQTSTNMPDFFSSSPFTDARNYTADLAALENTLKNRRINYRIFTTNVSLRAAKWSRLQK